MHHTGTRSNYEKALPIGYFDSVHFCHLLKQRLNGLSSRIAASGARQKFWYAPHGDGLVQEFHLFPRVDGKIIALAFIIVKGGV